MKKSIFVVFLICGFAVSSRADTVDYWQFFYNGKLLKSSSSYSSNDTILFYLSKIKDEDSISIKYFQCGICTNCKTKLKVSDENDKLLFTKEGTGTKNPLNFKVGDLMDFHEEAFILTYYNLFDKPRGRSSGTKSFIFTIIIKE